VLAGQLLLATGDEAACQRLLPGIADGSVLAAVAWTGPAGHWDPADAACSAVAAEDGWLLHGEAEYVLYGDSADLLLVAARTPDGIALFEVDPDQPRCRPDGPGEYGSESAGVRRWANYRGRAARLSCSFGGISWSPSGCRG
jgi:alkylation response protein AidB-like acyl-CoA dehydrogenase